MYVFKSIKDRLSNDNSQKPELQIFDLLQLSRREREHRQICLKLIRRFDCWKRGQGSAMKHHCISVRIRGALLRLRAKEAVLFYRIARNHRMKAFRRYIGKLPMRKTNACRAV